jgi:hypothetical protein
VRPARALQFGGILTVNWDRRELFGCLTDLPEERHPSRIVTQAFERVIEHHFGEAAIVVADGLVQPLEGLVGLSAECVHLSDVDGRDILVLCNQRA